MSRRARSAALAASIAAILWPAGVLAQTETPPDTLSVRPTIRATYNSNMLKLSPERAPNPRDDWQFTPSIDFIVRKLIGGRHQLTLVGSAGYDLHRRFTFIDRERIEAQGSIDVLLGEFCRVKPGIDLNFAQAQLSDQGVIVGNTERRVDYEFSFACKRPVGLYPSISGRITRTTNSANSRHVFNLKDDLVRAGVGYAVPSIGDLLVAVTYERFDRPALRSERGIDARADIFHYGFLFTRAVAPRVTIKAGANYFTVDPKRPSVPTYSGVGFEAGLQVRPTPRLVIDFDVGRSARNQSNTGSTYIVQTDAQLAATITASARSTVYFGGRFVNRDFRGELLIDTVRRRDRDRTWAGFANYDYDLTQKIRLGIGGRYERRTAPDSFFEYSSTAVTATIAAKL